MSGRGRRRGGSGGRAVSRMEGINHYWRTPSSPTHPDGPSTPDINHHSPTIDPLALPRREKCAGRIDFSLFSLAPPPTHTTTTTTATATSRPHCCVIMKHN